jgi:integrase
LTFLAIAIAFLPICYPILASIMKRTNLKLRKTLVNGEPYWQLTIPKPDGGRIRKTFKSRGTARQELYKTRTEMANYGGAYLSMSASLRAQALEAAKLLEPYNVTILDTVHAYIAQAEALKKSYPLADAIDHFLAGVAFDGRSASYRADLQSRLGRFQRDFRDRQLLCAQITTNDLDSWLRSLAVGPASRNAYRKRLATFFAYAMSRSWCSTNPASRCARAKELATTPGILSVDQQRRLLEVATPETLPYWAIGGFAGLRSAELERLEWRDLHWQSRLIEIGAAKAKSASKRFVKMEPVLLAWLAPYRGMAEGFVAPQDHWEGRKMADRQAAGIEQWPPNALRHSYASYHLAHFSDAARLSLELGHTSAHLIFKHYRELVLPEEAARYWNLYPAAVAAAAV